MTMTRPVVALLCVLCVSVVQFRTMTVIEGNSPQRRREHREDRLKSSRFRPICSKPDSPLDHMLLLGIEEPFSACSVSLWFNPER
jgi:hypothetical protein